MSRWARKIDGNHREVRQAVEALGWLWLDTASSRLGFDAIVVKDGRWVPLEVKDGSLPPSARKLTPREQAVHQRFRAHGVTIEIVTGVDESLDVLREPQRNYYK